MIEPRRLPFQPSSPNPTPAPARQSYSATALRMVEQSNSEPQGTGEELRVPGLQDPTDSETQSERKKEFRGCGKILRILRPLLIVVRVLMWVGKCAFNFLT